MDSHQNLYGAALLGGSGGGGGVFKLSLVKRAYKQTVLYSFKASARNGAYPYGVIEDSAGNLYGTTPIDHDGRFFNGGTVFELSPTQGNKYAFTELHDFSSGITGYSPAGVTMGADGALYGTTYMGGPYFGSNSGYGVAFKITL